MKIDQNSKWAKLPMWKKRLHGFAAYQYASFMALFHPVEVDKAAFSALSEQFLEQK